MLNEIYNEWISIGEPKILTGFEFTIIEEYRFLIIKIGIVKIWTKWDNRASKADTFSYLLLKYASFFLASM